MSETWKRWEGQVVNGEFPLVRYLGGSRHSAVFLTKGKAGAPEQVAIKLIAADPNTAVSQLERWKKSAELSHSNLLRVFESGQCELEGTPLLYVVMEAAEEDISQILPERPLTAAEVRELLPPVLDALAHIHGKGMVHGRVRPSNILAIGNLVKVSADTLRASGDLVASPDGWGGYDSPESSSRRLTPAADVWSLAVTLVQVLTQQRPLWHPAEPAAPSLPEHTPEPFREIASRCLQVEPQQRWTIADIAAALQPKQSQLATARPRPPSSADANANKKSLAWVYVLGLIAALVVIGVVVLGRNKSGSSSSAPPSAAVQPQESGPASGTPPDSSTVAVAENPSATPSAVKTNGHGSAVKLPKGSVGEGDVLERVMPRVSPSARQTIEGKIKVVVHVKVDPSGKVSEARLISPGPSKYFARLALEAAREWKFNPAQVQGQAVESEWNLRFGFRRIGTDVTPTRTAP